MIGFYIFMTLYFLVPIIGGAVALWLLFCLVRLLTRSAFPKESK